MIFVALATDYDGTLAQDGTVPTATMESLDRLKATGIRLILVTGRELPSLRECVDGMERFDLVVAENGALIFNPSSGEERLVGAPPPAQLVEALRAKGVTPLSVGRGIIATWTPHEATVIQTIRELGLDWQVIFNKGAVMCLAPGINKATGLQAALSALNLSGQNVVGIGDAENDLSFLTLCGCSVAVSNALDTVKAKVDIVTVADHGAGVAEFIAQWQQDASLLFSRLHRHDIYLGDAATSNPIDLPSDVGVTLVAGTSGVGKSKLASLLMERMTDRGYEVFVIDPEGDYENLSFLEHIGDTQRTPGAEEVIGLLRTPTTNLCLNLLGTDIHDRPAYFEKLWAEIHHLRASTGRPHWIVLDEAHHVAPQNAHVQQARFHADMSAAILITTQPRSLSPAALETVRTIVAVGETAAETIAEFCNLVGESTPPATPRPQESEVLVWRRGSRDGVERVKVGKAREDHQRHTRKYAEGKLGEDKSFYFTGPQALLNLRAHNLAAFLQLAQGVDDATWIFHLQSGDYSKWFEDSIKDEELASEVRLLEASEDPVSSRREVADCIKRRYAAIDAH